MAWEEFDRRFNDGQGSPLISFTAFRLRRGMLRKGLPVVSGPVAYSIPAAPVGASPDEYVGPIVGFWDIETTYSSQPRVLYVAVADAWGRVTEFALDDPRYAGRDWFDDSRLVSCAARFIERFDNVMTWNGKLFDTPVFNGRLNWHRVMWEREPDLYPWVRDYRDLMPLDIHTHTDLMYYASGQFNRIGRRSLGSVSEYFDTEHKKPLISVEIWDRAAGGDLDAYAYCRERGAGDVLVTRDVYAVLKPHIRNIHR
jgi:hypothetical protein